MQVPVEASARRGLAARARHTDDSHIALVPPRAASRHAGERRQLAGYPLGRRCQPLVAVNQIPARARKHLETERPRTDRSALARARASRPFPVPGTSYIVILDAGEGALRKVAGAEALAVGGSRP